MADELPATAAEWREQASQVGGSWWLRWHEWLTARSGPARTRSKRIGTASHPPLDPAPGRYVHLP